MGLFDFLNPSSGPSDPMASDAMNRAMLTAGLQMLSGRSQNLPFGQNMGQAGLAGIGAYDQHMNTLVNQKMQKMQLQNAMEQQKAQQQFKDLIGQAPAQVNSVMGNYQSPGSGILGGQVPMQQGVLQSLTMPGQENKLMGYASMLNKVPESPWDFI
jgi:hypothetical protein